MSKRLFVGNLPFQVDDAALAAAFQSQGHEVTSARVVLDRETGRSRGFAFVDFAADEQATAAMTAMNGFELQGRNLRVTEAEERRPPRPGGGPGGPRPRMDGPRGGGGGGGGGPSRGRSGGRWRDDDRRGPASGGSAGGGGGGGGGGDWDSGRGKKKRRQRNDGDDEGWRRGPGVDDDDW